MMMQISPNTAAAVDQKFPLSYNIDMLLDVVFHLTHYRKVRYV